MIEEIIYKKNLRNLFKLAVSELNDLKISISGLSINDLVNRQFIERAISDIIDKLEDRYNDLLEAVAIYSAFSESPSRGPMSDDYILVHGCNIPVCEIDAFLESKGKVVMAATSYDGSVELLIHSNLIKRMNDNKDFLAGKALEVVISIGILDEGDLNGYDTIIRRVANDVCNHFEISLDEAEHILKLTIDKLMK